MSGHRSEWVREHARKVIAAAGIAGVLFATAACSSSDTASAAATHSPTPTASATVTPSPTPSIKYLPSGLVAKGVAYDGKGVYLQTSIPDTNPAMQYDPAIADAAAKAHYSAAELAEAQRFIVRFIAEEAIDSTLNGGGTDFNGWMVSHKNEILPAQQAGMLNDMRRGKSPLASESWMTAQPDLAYVHGTDTPRVTQEAITPVKLRYVTGNGLEGLMLDTTAMYQMAVTFGDNGKKVQSTNAEISFAVAKDPADGGKWKIAGYNTSYHTSEYHIK